MQVRQLIGEKARPLSRAVTYSHRLDLEFIHPKEMNTQCGDIRMKPGLLCEIAKFLHNDDISSYSGRCRSTFRPSSIRGTRTTRSSGGRLLTAVESGVGLFFQYVAWEKTTSNDHPRHKFSSGHPAWTVASLTNRG